MENTNFEAPVGMFAGQTVFLPSLSRALTPFLDEKILNEAPKYKRIQHPRMRYPPQNQHMIENVCPGQTTHIIRMFLDLVWELIYGEVGNGLVARSRDCVTKRCEKWNTPEVVTAALRTIDVEETMQILREHKDVIGSPEMASSYPVNRGTAWLVECACRPEAGLSTDQIRVLCKLLTRVRCNFPDGDLLEQIDQVGDQISPIGLPRVFPALSKALAPLRSDPSTGRVFQKETASHVLTQFMRFAMGVVDTFDGYNQGNTVGNPTDIMPHYDMFRGALEEVKDVFYQTVVLDEFSPVPYSVRQHLSSINIRGAWGILWVAARALANDNGEGYWNTGCPLAFKMFDWLLHNVVEMENGSTRELGQLVDEMFDYSQIKLNHPVDVSAAFRPNGFEELVLPLEVLNTQAERWEGSFNTQDMGPHGEEFIYGPALEEPAPGDLDIFFESDAPDLVPYGPLVDTWKLVTRVSEPPQDTRCVICMEEFDSAAPDLAESSVACVELSLCKHVYHFICLDTWLNTGEPTSNRCPCCRAELCVKRPLGVPR